MTATKDGWSTTAVAAVVAGIIAAGTLVWEDASWRADILSRIARLEAENHLLIHALGLDEPHIKSNGP